MDSRGARHLSVRLSVGAAQGERVEVVSVDDNGPAGLRPGDTGMIVSIDDRVARVLFDSGHEIAVDPVAVRLRRVLRRSA